MFASSAVICGPHITWRTTSRKRSSNHPCQVSRNRRRQSVANSESGGKHRQAFRGKGNSNRSGREDYHKSNGISVLKARNEIQDNFLLLMADHIFEPETARAILKQRLAPGEVILAVDPNIDRIFDLEDATKVLRRGDRIVDIGKEIAHYDALDAGMFLCSPALFDHLEAAIKDGNCSLSDGMRQLIARARLRGLEIGDGQWQDLDTPEALAHAEGVFGGLFRHEPILEIMPRA
jgi:1L-myo-inositol 1-phosphate cytidylyltransferase